MFWLDTGFVLQGGVINLFTKYKQVNNHSRIANKEKEKYIVGQFK